jgi:hypothetical protein
MVRFWRIRLRRRIELVSEGEKSIISSFFYAL